MSWEYMTNDTKIAEAFLYDIFPKAAARDGKAMVRRNSLWYRHFSPHQQRELNI